MRIGHGFDVHALVAGRPLIIGGVTIPYERGLAGHSDADVLLHAVADAILGAAGLGDIGEHFPDTDAAYRNADSRVLLRHVLALIADRYVVVNVDATVIAQAPKCTEKFLKMRNTKRWTMISEKSVLNNLRQLTVLSLFKWTTGGDIFITTT